MRFRMAWGCCFAWVLALAAGCSCNQASQVKPEEAQARQVFHTFQVAVRSRDVETLWDLLHSQSRADIEAATQLIREDFAKADAEEKTRQAVALGLMSDEVAQLTAKEFLKTRRFAERYRELPDSEIDQVTVEDDRATVTYLEEDGDRDSLSLRREGGSWKVAIAVP